MAEYTIICIDHTLFIHSSVSGHLGCFYLLAIVNNASYAHGCSNMFESLLSTLWAIYPEEELLDDMVIL